MVHFPNTKVPIEETMGAMEEMKEKGKLLSIGVSNFSLQQTKDANRGAEKVPAGLQPGRVLARQQGDRGRPPTLLREQQDIDNLLLPAWATGSSRARVRGARWSAICKAYSKTPAQVALNWLVTGRNVFAIPRASRAEHVRENLGASGWEMKPEDRAQLEAAFPR